MAQYTREDLINAVIAELQINPNFFSEEEEPSPNIGPSVGSVLNMLNQEEPIGLDLRELNLQELSNNLGLSAISPSIAPGYQSQHPNTTNPWGGTVTPGPNYNTQTPAPPGLPGVVNPFNAIPDINIEPPSLPANTVTMPSVPEPMAPPAPNEPAPTPVAPETNPWSGTVTFGPNYNAPTAPTTVTPDDEETVGMQAMQDALNEQAHQQATEAVATQAVADMMNDYVSQDIGIGLSPNTQMQTTQAPETMDVGLGLYSGGESGASSGGSTGGGSSAGEGPGGPGTGSGHGVGGSGESTGTGGWREGGLITGKDRKVKVHPPEFMMGEEAVEVIGPEKLHMMNEMSKAVQAKRGQRANKMGLTGPHRQDTELAHITPRERAMLAAMSGGEKRNPVSGLPAYYDSDGPGGSDSDSGQNDTNDQGNTGMDTGMSGLGSPSDTSSMDPGTQMDTGLSGLGTPSDNSANNMGTRGEPYGGPDIGGMAESGGGVGINDFYYGGPSPNTQTIVVPSTPDEPTSSEDTTDELNELIQALETYQPIGYNGNWLTYAMPGGTYGGAQHRFLRRTNDPIEGNAAIYAADRTYDTTQFPNVPGISSGIATLPLSWLNSQTNVGGGPLGYLKALSGYGA